MLDVKQWTINHKTDHCDIIYKYCWRVALSNKCSYSSYYWFSVFYFLQPEKYVNLGIEPPKGVLLFGPPGTGKTLCARAVANRTDACFIRVIGSELVQKYVGEVCTSVIYLGHE